LISDFRLEVYEAAFFWGIMQRVVVISYRRFGTNDRSHFLIPEERNFVKIYFYRFFY